MNSVTAKQLSESMAHAARPVSGDTWYARRRGQPAVPMFRVVQTLHHDLLAVLLFPVRDFSGEYTWDVPRSILRDQLQVVTLKELNDLLKVREDTHSDIVLTGGVVPEIPERDVLMALMRDNRAYVPFLPWKQRAKLLWYRITEVLF